MAVPIIAPAKGMRKFEFEQSKYEFLDGVLPTRMVCVGSSNSGKGIAVQSMILDVFRGQWKRIYYFSKTASIDHTLEPIEHYVRNVLKVPPEEEWKFEDWNPEVVRGIIDQQKAIIRYQKKHNQKKLWQICIVCDDMAGNIEIMRGKRGEALRELFLMGRHYGISCIVTAQKFRLLDTILRVNATYMIYFAARSRIDLDAFLEENSNLAPGGKKQLEEIYKIATADPFSFLAVNMMTKDKSKIFMRNFESFLVLN